MRTTNFIYQETTESRRFTPMGMSSHGAAINRAFRPIRRRRPSPSGWVWLCTVILSPRHVQSSVNIRKVGTEENKSPVDPPVVGVNHAPHHANRSNGSSRDDRSQGTVPESPAVSPESPVEAKDFVQWCNQVLGIQTLLAVETFDYPDFAKIHKEQIEEPWCDLYDDDDALVSLSESHLPPIPVRGLSASRNIAQGEVVISIPYHAMITVFTTIDHDPVLSRLLGPEARQRFGWEDTYFELPLLTFSILYHRRLGLSSPLYHYIQILMNTPVETIPFLWNQTKLRSETTEGVQRISRGIKRDIREMYEVVMTVLLSNYPQIFGKEATAKDEEWMYSFPMFQWAFAMLNSRHWHLPIQSLDPAHIHEASAAANKKKNDSNFVSPSSASQVPPAEQPTEEWVNKQQIDESIAESKNSTGGNETPQKPISHSFMAPMADLLNFGPPCTRGNYNKATQTFDIVATCPFRKGQEVTFWYSGDCDDVIIANYGFTHPMVPKCLSAEDWRERSDLWRKHAEATEGQLLSAYKELDELDAELQRADSVIDRCDCDRDNYDLKEELAYPQRDSYAASRKDSGPRVRGTQHNENGSHGDENHRSSIRRKWQHTRKSDQGL